MKSGQREPEVFVYRSRIAAPAPTVYQWHMRRGAFLRLSPPWDRIRLLDPGSGLVEGGRTEFEVSMGPLTRRWVAEYRDVVDGRGFRDVQIAGPFASWEHTHTIVPDGPDVCWLEDRIEFALPGGAFAHRLAAPLIRQKLRATFAYRHRTTAADIRRHGRTAQATPMNILISGSSGLVGRALAPFLTTGGHSITRLVRRAASADAGVRWDPILGSIDCDRLEGFDAVVHLAGENIASGRWTDRRKRCIRESRTQGTRLLCEALATLARPPKTLVCASATGFYGDRGDAVLDEQSPPGTGFLAEVCREWEAACEPARRKGIRVVNLRFGVVLSPAGGALASMLTPFKLGLGGVIGSGRQIWSWIAIDDVVGSIHHGLTCDRLDGPTNVVSPNPATNREFVKTLGKVMRRPTFFPLPAPVARLVLGEMADELLLASARVVPRRLEETEYTFAYPQLEGALRHVLGR